MLTLATTFSLLGSKSPLIADPSLVDALWDFEENQMGLIINIFPSITVPAAYRGRSGLHVALRTYYSAHHDVAPDVAAITKARAGTLRSHGVSDP